MTQLDSATLRFYRRCGEYCRSSACGRIIGVLEVDFGELLPEIDAGNRLVVTVDAPLEVWLWPGAVDWQAQLDPKWSHVRPALAIAADNIARPWVDRARAHILTLTGREILDAVEQHKSIEVPRGRS